MLPQNAFKGIPKTQATQMLKEEHQAPPYIPKEPLVQTGFLKVDYKVPLYNANPTTYLVKSP